jgi:uncharacterized protein YlxW (UPF0749 family)
MNMAVTPGIVAAQASVPAKTHAQEIADLKNRVIDVERIAKNTVSELANRLATLEKKVG